MNQLTTIQRKLLYSIGIALLLYPVIALGRPAGKVDKNTRRSVGGGTLAQLRQEYELGESSLGDVDPASSAMTLVLLGFRGIAAELLCLEAIENQKLKNWAKLRANVDSIILLQPHFLKVWEFQGWNLAYNVSAQWDAVPDRYYWVKEGTKFTMKGTERNSQFPELYWWTGRILGQKIGRCDEWRYFRRYFRVDPNHEKFKGEPDPGMSSFNLALGLEEFDDNYLAAKYWYRVANLIDESREQDIQEPLIFRQHPAKSQLEYAEALQREGKFGERTKIAWEIANTNWTTKYQDGKPGFGLEYFLVLPDGGYVFLEADTEEEFKSLIVDRDNQEYNKASSLAKIHAVDFFQKIVNYRYWRTRSLAEADATTEKAHRELYEGKERYKEGKTSEARELIISGMQGFEDLLAKYPDLLTDASTIEECLMGVLYLQAIYRLEQVPMPENLPLQRLNPNPGLPAQSLVQRENARLQSLISQFRRENTGQ